MKVTQTPQSIILTPEFENEVKRLNLFFPGKEEKTFPRTPSGQRLLNAIIKDFQHTYSYSYGYLSALVQEVPLLPLPDLSKYGFNFQPLPHQINALQNMITFNQHGVFLEMGLGKTFASIWRIIHSIHTEGGLRFLVVCPKRVIPTWINEVKKFCGKENPHFTTIVLDDKYTVEARANLLKTAQFATTPVVFVTNYESFRHDNEVIKAFEEANALWDMAILDESVKIRYTNTKVQRGLIQIMRLFKKRYILSGLPAPQSLSDYIGQFAFMHSVMFGYTQRNKFESDYAYRNSYTHRIDAWRDVQWIHERIHEFATVITKKDAGINLPEKMYVTRECEMTSAQKKFYNDLAVRFIASVEEMGPIKAGSVEAIHVLARLTRLSQASNGWACGVPDLSAVKDVEWFDAGYNEEDQEPIPTLPPILFDPNPKLEMLLEVLDEISPIVSHDDSSIEKPPPFVVVARYTHEILEIKKRLEGEGYKVAVIRGGLTTAKQIEIQERFDLLEYDGLIINISAGKYGLNLQKANTLIYFSCDYNWDSRGQSEERVHRLGQTNPVTIVDLVSSGTIDQEIIERLKEKKSVSDLILKHPRAVLPEEYELLER